MKEPENPCVVKLPFAIKEGVLWSGLSAIYSKPFKDTNVASPACYDPRFPFI